MGQWSRTDYKSFVAGASLSAFRAVYLSAANTVSYPATTASCIIGITQDKASLGSMVPVQLIANGGSAKMECQDTIAAAAFVAVQTATGKAIPMASATTTAYFIGVCNEAVSATGTIAEVILFPNQVIIS